MLQVGARAHKRADNWGVACDMHASLWTTFWDLLLVGRLHHQVRLTIANGLAPGKDDKSGMSWAQIWTGLA